MPVRNIVVPICAGVPAETQLAASLGIARRMGGHINAIHIAPNPPAMLASMPVLPVSAGITLDRLDEMNRQEEAAARSRFEAWRAAHQLGTAMSAEMLSSTFASWSSRQGFVEQEVALEGRLGDLIVLNRPTSEHLATQRAFEAAVFESGRPVLLVPENPPDNLFRHMFIAWNGSLEATRVVAGCIDLLHEADRVTVFSCVAAEPNPPDRLDLVEALTWHGIRAHRVRCEAEPGGVGPTLLRAALEREATVIVSGGYTHSRFAEILLGGVTRHLLRHTSLPLLMAH